MRSPCTICKKESTLSLTVRDEKESVMEVLLCDKCLEDFKKGGSVSKKIKEAFKNGGFGKN